MLVAVQIVLEMHIYELQLSISAARKGLTHMTYDI